MTTYAQGTRKYENRLHYCTDMSHIWRASMDSTIPRELIRSGAGGQSKVSSMKLQFDGPYV